MKVAVLTAGFIVLTVLRLASAPTVGEVRFDEGRTSNPAHLKPYGPITLLRVYCMPEKECPACLALKKHLSKIGCKFVKSNDKRRFSSYPTCVYSNGYMMWFDSGEEVYGKRCNIYSPLEVITIESSQ